MAYSNPRILDTDRKVKAARGKRGKVKLRLIASFSGPPSLEEKQTPVQWRYEQKRKAPLFHRGGDRIECRCGNTDLKVLRRVRGRITLYARLLVGEITGLGDHSHLSNTFHSRTECRPQTPGEIEEGRRFLFGLPFSATPSVIPISGEVTNA